MSALEEGYKMSIEEIDSMGYARGLDICSSKKEKKNGKYCKWLLDLYRNKSEENIKMSNKQKIMLEDLYKIKDALVLFKRKF